MTFFKIEVSEPKGGFGVSRDMLRKFKTTAMRRVGMMWWKDFRPLHFTTKGARRYHYAPRKTHNIFTGRIYKHKDNHPIRSLRGKNRAEDGRPLVESGSAMRASRNKRIDATSKSCHVRMPGIQNLNYSPSRNKKIEMSKEFKAITGDELRALSKRARESLLSQLKSNNARPMRVRVIT